MMDDKWQEIETEQFRAAMTVIETVLGNLNNNDCVRVARDVFWRHRDIHYNNTVPMEGREVGPPADTEDMCLDVMLALGGMRSSIDTAIAIIGAAGGVQIVD